MQAPEAAPTSVEGATALALSQVQVIIDDALGPRKKKYRDEDFVGPDAVGGLSNVDPRAFNWERTSAICRQPLVVDKYASEDIVQVTVCGRAVL